MRDIDVLGERRRMRVVVRLAYSSVVACVVACVPLFLNGLKAWDFVRIPVGREPFMDLLFLTTAADCMRVNPLWPSNDVQCDTWPDYFAYNYPLFWAQSFNFLELYTEKTGALGLAFIILYAVSLASLTFVILVSGRGLLQVLVIIVAGLSPPALLLMERGNVDVIIFALLTGASILYISKFRKLAAIVIALATVAKLFPIGAALLLVTDRSRRKVAISLYIALTGTGLIWIASQIPTIMTTTQSQAGDSFGVSVLPMWAFQKLNYSVCCGGMWPRLIGFVIFGLSILVLAIFLRRRKTGLFSTTLRSLSRGINEDRVSSVLFVGGTGTFLASYFVGTSWDYRLVFLTFVIAALSRLNTQTAWIVGGILLFGQFMSVGVPGLLQGIWDIAVVVAVVPVMTWLLFEVVRCKMREEI